MIGGAADEQAQHGGQVCHLSPTAEKAASAGKVIGGAGDEQAQHGGQVCHLSPTAEEEAPAGKMIGGAGDEKAFEDLPGGRAEGLRQGPLAVPWALGTEGLTCQRTLSETRGLLEGNSE